MTENIHHKYSGNICHKCGGDAPGWKCSGCGVTSNSFDARHKLICPQEGKMEAMCLACSEAESKCTC